MQTKIRSFLRAAPDKLLISCDLSQAETWVVAHLANDPNMKHNLIYSDIHRETAVAFFNKLLAEITVDERFSAKKSNHAFSYRMTPPRFTQVYNKEATDIGLPPITIKRAEYFSKEWHKLYINIKSWWANIEIQLGKDMTLITPYGRKRMFFGAWGDELFKEATAFVPQSTVESHFDGYIQPELGIKGGLKEFWLRHKHDKEISICQQGHDSALIEAPKAHAKDICLELKSILHRPMLINGEMFTIPVDGEIGEDWGHLEKVA